MKKIIFALFVVLFGCSKDKTLTVEEQLQKDIATIDKYVTDNSIANVVKDPSGLRYTIVATGTGVKPTLTSKLTVRYTGYLLSTGANFDVHNTAIAFTDPLSSLIQGWQIGFQLLPEGSKAILFIPSGLGYGPTVTGNRSIPPNSNLGFTVELVKVR